MQNPPGRSIRIIRYALAWMCVAATLGSTSWASPRTGATFVLGSLIDGDEVVLDLLLVPHKMGVVGVSVHFGVSSPDLHVVGVEAGSFIEDGDILSFQSNDSDGSIRAGFTRKGASAAADGTGSLVRIRLRAGAHIAGPASISFVTVHLITREGAIVQLEAAEVDALLDRTLVALPTSADEAVTLEDTPVTIDVLANDAPGLATDPASLAVIALPSQGSVTIELQSGKVRYEPAVDFCGTDSFSYSVEGVVDHRSEETAVSVDVTCVNDVPTFVAGEVPEVAEDAGPIEVSGFLSSLSPGPTNESDQSLTISLEADPADLFAVLPTVSLTGDLSFQPAADRFGSATVTVSVHDDGGTADGGKDLAVARFRITIRPVNDGPIASADAFSLLEGSVLRAPAGALLLNDEDPEDDPITARLETGVTDGTLLLSADGSFVYTPRSGFSGTDGFSYRATDGSADSPVARVTLTIVPDEDQDGVPAMAEDGAPNGGDGNGDGLPDANQENVTSLPIATGEKAGEYLTLISPPGTRLIRVESLPDNPSLDDYPAGAETPVGFISFQVHDLAPAATQVVTILVPRGVTAVDYLKYGPTPDRPVPHWYSFAYDGTTGALIVAETPEAQGYIELHFTDGARGDDDLTANGVLVDPGVPVLTSNRLPAATDDRARTDEDTVVSIDVLANDSDLDGDPLSILSVTAPAHGMAFIDAGNLVRYVPAPDFHGSDEFSVSVSDGRGSPVSASVTVTVDAVNDVPRFTGMPSDLTVREGERVMLTWTADDIDGDVLSFHGLTLPPAAQLNPQTGTVFWIATGSSARFAIRVSDGVEVASSPLVTVTVQTVDRFAVVIAGVHQRPGISTTAAAIGEVRLVEAAGILEYDFSVTRLTAPMISTTLYVGAVGEEAIPLTTVMPSQRAADGRSAEFRGSVALSSIGVPARELVGRLRTGGLGLFVTSHAYPDGEARGQLLTLSNRAPSSPDLSATPVVVVSRPDAAAVVSHGASVDPDGDQVLYITQVATDAGFSRIVDERVTRQPAAWVLPAGWILAALRGGPRNEDGRSDGPAVLHVRVIASDGALWAVSSPATIEVLTATGTDDVRNGLPTVYSLEGNYPNPFNPVTTIRFDMPEAAPVHLSVIDVMGREVRVLMDGTLEAGRHEATFDGAGMPSGTYLYRLTTPAGVFSKTMVLLK